jgi:hypothetical protein
MNNKELLINNGYIDITIFENPSFNGALIGVSNDGRAIYDYDKMIESVMKEEGWTQQDAIDWIEVNTLRSLAYVENSPIIMYKLEE